MNDYASEPIKKVLQKCVAPCIQYTLEIEKILDNRSNPVLVPDASGAGGYCTLPDRMITSKHRLPPATFSIRADLAQFP